MARTLITFLGAGAYTETTYRWESLGAHRTTHVAAALARLWGADRITVLATTQAERTNREGLETALRAAGSTPPVLRRIADGRTEEQLWQQFEVLRDALQQAATGPVLIDITHGFRAQSFFAGAVLGVLRASGREPNDLAIGYGEFRGGDADSPIWDLSLFLELMEWAEALGLFLRTGVAEPLITLGRISQRRQAKVATAAGTRDFPSFGSLVGSIERFADDLATVRIASMITGYEPRDTKKPSARGSAARVLDAIAQCRDEVQSRLPPLGLILDELESALEPLPAPRLDSVEGRTAQSALARFYRHLRRYPEAAIVVRESRVGEYAHDARAVEVNSAGFDNYLRHAADRRFSDTDSSAGEIADVRNDIQHGGFRKQPGTGTTLKRRVSDLVERFAVLDAPVADNGARTPSQQERTLFVSRHPGAVEWAHSQGITVDDWLDHLDITQIGPGDTVIGSLPVNLAADVCAAGARYLHLSLNLPAAWRGRELSAQDLYACGARLQEFHVTGQQED